MVQTSLTIFIDPLTGDDRNPGTEKGAPKRNISSVPSLHGVAVYLKRGTTTTLKSNVYVFNTFIGAYGTGAALPVINVASGGNFGLSIQGGEFHMSGVSIQGHAGTRISTSAVSAAKASRVIVEDSEFADFGNAVVFGGTDGIIRRNRISKVTNNGIFGGNRNQLAPSRTLISENVIDITGAANDAITLHDGMGFGIGNLITFNRISGVNRENAIDIQDQYGDTLIEGNIIDGSGSYPIITSPTPADMHEVSGTVIRGNQISTSTSAAIYSRTRNALIAANLISNVASQRMAAGIVVADAARIADNEIEVPPGSVRSAIALAHDSGQPMYSGEISGNRIVNLSKAPFIGVMSASPQDLLDGWSIDRNVYVAQDTSAKAFVGMSFDMWRNGGNGTLVMFKDRNSTLSPIAP